MVLGIKKMPVMDKKLQNWLLSHAACYIEYHQSDKAIVLLEALRKIVPKNSNIYRMLSYAYLEVGRSEDCIKSANDFLKYSHDGADTRAIRWIRGRARLRKNNIESR